MKRFSSKPNDPHAIILKEVGRKNSIEVREFARINDIASACFRYFFNKSACNQYPSTLKSANSSVYKLFFKGQMEQKISEENICFADFHFVQICDPIIIAISLFYSFRGYTSFYAYCISPVFFVTSNC